MRGNLVGMIPEALCGEDPEGHPMVHGCRRPHSARTSGKPKKRREESGPPPSRRTKRGRRLARDRSREPLHGKQDASARRRKVMPRSSSRREVRRRR